MECQWFHNCHNPAEFDVEHFQLGWVPICQEHVTWLGESPSPTQFIPPMVAARLRQFSAVFN